MKDEAIRRGTRARLESFAAQDIGEGEMEKLLNQPKVFDNTGSRLSRKLYAAIDRKNPAPLTIIEFLNVRKKKDELKLERHNSALDDKNPVFIKNAGNAKIELAHCCTPIPGDDIVGYVTKGKGITVHRVNCPNVQKAGSRLSASNGRRSSASRPIRSTSRSTRMTGMAYWRISSLAHLRAKGSRSMTSRPR
jgi:(p)ppGpp synthase/HD superfamily hydrolase